MPNRKEADEVVDRNDKMTRNENKQETETNLLKHYT